MNAVNEVSPSDEGSVLMPLLCVNKKKKNQVVVRINTTYWYDKNGAYFKKSLKILKRKSFGYNYLLEECRMAGSYDCISRIAGIDSLPDGVYEVVVCDVSRDYETGYVEDWDLKLVPFFS